VLNDQNSEIEALRSAHGRRLARLKSILTSYRLVKQQLRLYEDDYMWSVFVFIVIYFRFNWFTLQCHFAVFSWNSANDSTYCYTFLCSVVCPSVVCLFVHPAKTV